MREGPFRRRFDQKGPPAIAAPPLVPDVVERDDGWFEVGVGDGALGPFETRTFATAVAAREMQRSMGARA